MDTGTPRRRLSVKKRYVAIVVALLFSGVSGLAYYRYSRAIPEPTVEHTLTITDDSERPVDIAWPSAQASFGTVEHGILASKPGQMPLPTASTAKLITALTVLQEKPLAPGEQGPTLTIDRRDIELYNTYYSVGGSLVAVRLGEQMSQYQMLQAILIRSSNNLADSLALWAFGSMEAYREAAQKYVDSLGMANTTVGTDASGFSPTTTSTADDLTRLGIAAMKHDVVREIVQQPSSSFPTDGTKPNTNWMLGQNGVVGIKTGNIPEAGGVFIVASEYTPEGEEPITLVGAVQGETSTYAAIARSAELAESMKSLFVKTTHIKKGTLVAKLSTPWGESSDIVAADDVTTFGWKYREIKPETTLDVNTPFEPGAAVGKVSVQGQSSSLVATRKVGHPSWQWRLATSR